MKNDECIRNNNKSFVQDVSIGLKCNICISRSFL